VKDGREKGVGKEVIELIKMLKKNKQIFHIHGLIFEFQSKSGDDLKCN
jgi:hypothetical protein